MGNQAGFRQGLKTETLCWCDKKGLEFSDDQALEKAKRSGKAYVRVSRPNSLPTPYQLTKDPKWDVGGEYYQMYDLELECDDDGDKDPDGSLNTSDDSYSVDNIGDNGDSDKGVNLLAKRSHKEIKKMIRESAKKQEQEPYDPNDAETQKLFEEFGDILRVKKGLK
ncbi:MAG: hypothetical protein V3S16_03740, partial [Candidatus Desulfatibia sp.]|uniref:hypothetical protein n=1 Tax=Candidatus Desulfatibia sp. TaxID=3101189 RepID=UPI002F30AE62